MTWDESSGLGVSNRKQRPVSIGSVVEPPWRGFRSGQGQSSMISIGKAPAEYATWYGTGGVSCRLQLPLSPDLLGQVVRTRRECGLGELVQIF